VRVLHLMDSGGLYGAEQMLLTLMEQQRERGLEPHLLSAGVPDEAPKPVEEEARRRGLEVTAWRMEPRFNPGDARRILEWSHEHGTDVLHSHGYKFNVLAGMWPRRVRRAPLVATLHGYITGRVFSRGWLYTRADQLLLPRMDAVVLVSDAMRTRVPWTVARSSRTHVIENGLDVERVRSRATLEVPEEIAGFCEAHDPVLVGVGRLSAEKGFDRLIRIAARLRDRWPRIGVLIIGEGKLRASLTTLASSSGLGNDVLMPGFSDRVPAVMARTDLVCMPSHTEGLPITLLEAMAVGVPLAVTPVGEMPRVLGDGRGGAILDGADEGAMADTIAACLDQPGQRADRVRWATARLEADYSARRMAEAYRDVYAQVLGVTAERVRG